MFLGVLYAYFLSIFFLINICYFSLTFRCFVVTMSDFFPSVSDTCCISFGAYFARSVLLLNNNNYDYISRYVRRKRHTHIANERYDRPPYRHIFFHLASSWSATARTLNRWKTKRKEVKWSEVKKQETTLTLSSLKLL